MLDRTACDWTLPHLGALISKLPTWDRFPEATLELAHAFDRLLRLACGT